MNSFEPDLIVSTSLLLQTFYNVSDEQKSFLYTDTSFT